jgi:hypothetical protein
VRHEDGERAAEPLAEALALWRGEPCADLPTTSDSPWLQALRATLTARQRGYSGTMALTAGALTTMVAVAIAGFAVTAAHADAATRAATISPAWQRSLHCGVPGWWIRWCH